MQISVSEWVIVAAIVGLVLITAMRSGWRISLKAKDTAQNELVFQTRRDEAD